MTTSRALVPQLLASDDRRSKYEGTDSIVALVWPGCYPQVLPRDEGEGLSASSTTGSSITASSTTALIVPSTRNFTSLESVEGRCPTFVTGGQLLRLQGATPSTAAKVDFSHKLTDKINCHPTKVLPMMSLAACLAYGSYLDDSRADRALSGWADISSQATWDLLLDSNFESIATGSTSRPDAVSASRDEEVNEIVDAPRFDYGKVVAYAREMGLPTNFPL